MARPTKYNKEILEKTYAYIQSCDVVEEMTQFTTHDGKEGVSWAHRLLTAKLPTFARLSFILRVDKDTIQEWRKSHKEFSVACTALLALQEAKLVEGGAAGLYSSQIVNRILAANHGYVDRSGAPQLPPGPTLIQNNYNLIADPTYREAVRVHDTVVKDVIIKQIKARRVPQPSPYGNTKDSAGGQS